MKKLIVLYVTLAALVFGSASPALAQHCNVQKGDSMWRIAKEYHVLFHDVLRLNRHLHKNPNLIHPNDRVELPDGSSGSETTENGQGASGSDQEQSTEAGTSKEATEVLRLVNAERSKQGLRSLKLAEDLTSIANTKARDMAVNRYFDHRSPTYGSPFEMLQKFGVSYKSAGENIAAGQQTPAQVMESWMNSSGHRANILNSSYTELGVGFYAGGSYDTYWVQLFVGR